MNHRLTAGRKLGGNRYLSVLILDPKDAVMIRIQVKLAWNPRTDFSDVLTFQLKLNKNDRNFV